MSRFIISSRCECQAGLSATLDEHRHVVVGWAKRRGASELAPAHSINAHLERFDVGWLCPFCGRNTLRTFYAGALRATPAAPAEDPGAGSSTPPAAPRSPAA
jgi:hypothetical protein